MGETFSWGFVTIIKERWVDLCLSSGYATMEYKWSFGLIFFINNRVGTVKIHKNVVI